MYVSENNGTGGGISASPDSKLIYTGEQVSISPVGALPGHFSGKTMPPVDKTIRAAGDMIVLPNELAEKTKAITAYDCSGRLLQKVVVKKNTIDVRKDLNLPTGIYIVKVSMIR